MRKTITHTLAVRNETELPLFAWAERKFSPVAHDGYAIRHVQRVLRCSRSKARLVTELAGLGLGSER